MSNELTNAEITLAVMGLVFALSWIVWLDRYLTRRRSALLNGEHLARMQAQATEWTFNAPRNDWWEVSASEWSRQAFDIAGAQVHSFSRQRVVRDPLGHVMAVHYEEILAPDFNQRVNAPQTHGALVLAKAA